jgi:hypothetical protein
VVQEDGDDREGPDAVETAVLADPEPDGRTPTRVTWRSHVHRPIPIDTTSKCVSPCWSS